ncbi:MAG: hypothetical protein ABIH49_00605 [archaeon]
MINESEEEVAKSVVTELYREGFIQTLYNTESEKHQGEGWTLKSGIWSPWFLNLRPLGDSPQLANYISSAMNRMIRGNVPGLTKMVGIEMAGVPLVASIGTVTGYGCEFIPYAYTRPFPGGEKPRTPEEAVEILSRMGAPNYKYGQKELVEGSLREGDVLCITDDMVTNFGSKLIARHILEHEIQRRGIYLENVKIDDVAVVLDREQGGAEEAKKYGMRLHSLVKFKTQGLEYLEEAMHPGEFVLIADYQQNPERYQNRDMQKEVLEMAAKVRGN